MPAGPGVRIKLSWCAGKENSERSSEWLVRVPRETAPPEREDDRQAGRQVDRERRLTVEDR